ncbi:uncharacterized protein FFUJ_00122 [Fusarium fujikuroi IMI 58289]|uniref:non-specific serine/threonine protein kinase n=1 Tax=Gibberella fujikuroi (strain CBS 195.34 / IMI 58289 / NRRL A-6831) TaxID=1279085 RepID=S0DPC7_GIBF5|nr:uncharacterized protein FFUJ_00122 [Fusarium fujikuroi IMI 58289]CCT63252.1 uncharacterized protein FFUJ_00122 [Fusarium fujikuroi IMI 58289]SCN71342.1 uncharacterized protein FFM5_00127 [Fusarium fujikuroi]
MPEVEYPDYRLHPWVFQEWLRGRFRDNTIRVECKNACFVFHLPDGEELTEAEICELRGKSSWEKPSSITKFRKWVMQNQRIGLNGFEQTATYVSVSSLKDYWTNARIQEVLELCLIEADIEQIAERFLRTFSLLVQIGRHRDIKIFLDRDFDDETFASPGLAQGRLPDFSDIFEKHWSFFPVEFKSHLTQRQELLSRQILPIKYYELFKKGNRRSESALAKVQIESDYCDLVPKDTPLVFKIYRGDELREDFKVETDNYSNLNGEAQHAVTKCYGSFSCEETDFRVIILEYASEGSLRSFFRNIHPPVSVLEFRELWVNLVGLLDGLEALHTCHDSKQGIHQDIKPDNILVFPKSSESRFDVRFKLTDFHVTEFKHLDREGKMMINNWGSRLYTMPPPGPGKGKEACPGESPASKSKYLALCVQTGPIYTTLKEFDTSSFKSDAALLQEMKSVYTRIRGARSKHNSLFIPIGLEFVKFTLWNQKHGYISICDRPDSVPPKTQLEYDYDPKPLDFLPPMPAQVFLHYLEHGEEGWNKLRYLWLPKLPVRREKRVIEGHEASYGWGIHIIEGPNRWAIFAMLLTTVFGSALAALLWSAIHNDIQGGTGLGQLIIALSSAILTASLFRLGYL